MSASSGNITVQSNIFCVLPMHNEPLLLYSLLETKEGALAAEEFPNKPQWQTDNKHLKIYYTKHPSFQPTCILNRATYTDHIALYTGCSQQEGISNWVKLAFKYLASASHWNAKTW